MAITPDPGVAVAATGLMSNLKTFAGPMATIIASFVAVIVTGYFAWQQKNIALQQKEIVRDKLRLDLFDRRYKAFESIFPYYNSLLGWKETDEQKEARTNFFMAYYHSRFLFGSNVEDVFKKLIDTVNKVIGTKENSDSNRQDPELFLMFFYESQDILTNLFENRLDMLKAAIWPYISFIKTE